jgi:hypothetical protein
MRCSPIVEIRDQAPSQIFTSNGPVPQEGSILLPAGSNLSKPPINASGVANGPTMTAAFRPSPNNSQNQSENQWGADQGRWANGIAGNTPQSLSPASGHRGSNNAGNGINTMNFSNRVSDASPSTKSMDLSPEASGSSMNGQQHRSSTSSGHPTPSSSGAGIGGKGSSVSYTPPSEHRDPPAVPGTSQNRDATSMSQNSFFNDFPQSLAGFSPGQFNLPPTPGKDGTGQESQGGAPSPFPSFPRGWDSGLNGMEMPGASPGDASMAMFTEMLGMNWDPQTQSQGQGQNSQQQQQRGNSQG